MHKKKERRGGAPLEHKTTNSLFLQSFHPAGVA